MICTILLSSQMSNRECSYILKAVFDFGVIAKCICLSQISRYMQPSHQEVGKPSQNATQPCARAQGCVNDDLKG